MISTGQLLTGFAKSYGALVAARVLVGLGEAFDPIAGSLIADTFDDANRGKGMFSLMIINIMV